MTFSADLDRVSLRIVDANLNRAREALRVLEEFARLGIEDAALSAMAKDMRHALAACIPPTLSDRLWVSRDIVGDVGRELATESEYQRADARAVAVAAGKRLGEALRTVEEYGKTIDASFAAAVEQLRYKGYELERRLNVATTPKRFARVRLYVIVTQVFCRGDWPAVAHAALRGGADAIQLREKDLSDRELLARAKRLASLCHEHDALLIVNDRPDIAALSGADGVHLGRADLRVREARRVLSPGCIVGVSTRAPDEVSATAETAPDYVAVGPMFATTTKPQDEIAGPAALAAARARTSLPLVAIGGIVPGRVESVLSEAECAICVCQAVVSDPDPERAATEFRQLIDSFATQRSLSPNA